MRLKFEDIVFFIVIGLIIFIGLWLLKGSPPINTVLISIIMFVATSELLIWKKMFSMDKNTAISFVKLKNTINNLIDNQKEIKTNLNKIERLIKSK